MVRELCDDVIKWKHSPRYWPFLLGMHRSPVNSPHKGQCHGALMFLWSAPWINGWVNNREAGDLRRHRAYYDVIAIRWDLKVSFEFVGCHPSRHIQNERDISYALYSYCWKRWENNRTEEIGLVTPTQHHWSMTGTGQVDIHTRKLCISNGSYFPYVLSVLAPYSVPPPKLCFAVLTKKMYNPCMYHCFDLNVVIIWFIHPHK